MAEKHDGKFFCVRDLPEATKKKIKHYAIDHDVTMAQAVEALVDKADQQLLDALLEMYRCILADDATGARRGAEEVQRLIGQSDVV